MDDDEWRGEPELSPSVLFFLSFLLFFSHGLDFVFFDALLKLMRTRLWDGDDVLSND